jgi:hypothetical protein
MKIERIEKPLTEKESQKLWAIVGGISILRREINHMGKAPCNNIIKENKIHASLSKAYDDLDELYKSKFEGYRVIGENGEELSDIEEAYHGKIISNILGKQGVN